MALVSLAEAKAQLDIQTTADDDELQRYIDALTAPIERYVGPVENREVAEDLEGRTTTLCLSSVPAVSLISIVPVLAGGQAIAVDTVHLDGAKGIVRRLDGGSFRGGLWTVTYTAGRGSVPPTIKVAALILLQHLWRTQYGAARGASGGTDDYDVNEPVVGWGYAIPNRVLQLLEPYRVPPGVA
ncbi:head-tail connector protein [Streptomyces hydrogenans]|uniref:head-tail connector protein n=1 Tax=Streptomyces hydrogenans TaxID=1873719 RepID=UPI0035E016DD